MYQILPSVEHSRDPLYQHLSQLVYIFYFFVHLFKLYSDSDLAFPGGYVIKRADEVVIVATKKKLAHPLKKAATIAASLAKETTTSTPVYPYPFSYYPSLGKGTTKPFDLDHGYVSSLLKHPQRVEPPTTSPLPLDKGKCVTSPLTVEVGPGHEAAPFVEPKTTAEMPLDAFLSSTSGTAGSSATQAKSSPLAKLQELLSLSASQIL
ncbi:histone deacetylase 5-like [Pyrus ussuriensis x Pyrus communis]|uniref:Histone deacetylase 5-like n=1 Tax=Pyrus ussuriensis x Pyrus communis TaxID=2448454 RepID=A0A5N5HDL2_9ROSA|nr:histone deacetylase 5-like [Pyrus ussuriensis x Pyrus communis]